MLLFAAVVVVVVVVVVVGCVWLAGLVFVVAVCVCMSCQALPARRAPTVTWLPDHVLPDVEVNGVARRGGQRRCVFVFSWIVFVRVVRACVCWIFSSTRTGVRRQATL